jgi:hypothetical protein
MAAAGPSPDVVMLSLGQFTKPVKRRPFMCCKSVDLDRDEFIFRCPGTERDLDLVVQAIHEGCGTVGVTGENKARIIALATELGFLALLDRARATPDGPAPRADVARLQAELAALREQLGRPAPLDSAIHPDALFLLLRAQASRFALLYRGTRDGFAAVAFHERCDGYARTLTVIRTDAQAVFGGFAAVAWSSDGNSTADPSGASFLFALPRQPDAAPRAPRVFPLRDSRSRHAIIGRADCGPIFGGGPDLLVADRANEGALSSCAYFGWSYANDTGGEGWRFLAGAPGFRIQEIEVFEAVS